MSNAIRIIKPYWYEGTWVFDDPAVELVREPFVSGVPEMIDRIVADIPDARQGFRLLFSDRPFPGFDREVRLLHGEYGGSWYRSDDLEMEGWLCPALFRYFDAAPERIFVKVEPVDRGPRPADPAQG